MTSAVLVLVESPFAPSLDHTSEEHITYARECLSDCFKRGEFPFASHLLYTQPGILDDTNPSERQLGIEAGLSWGRNAAYTVMYLDMGLSKGMMLGLRSAIQNNRSIQLRSLRVSDVLHSDREQANGLVSARRVITKFTHQAQQYRNQIRACELEQAWLEKFEAELAQATVKFFLAPIPTLSEVAQDKSRIIEDVTTPGHTFNGGRVVE